MVIVEVFIHLMNILQAKSLDYLQIQAYTRGLLPMPFAGNFEKASIFVIMLNSGLSAGDYFAEQYRPEFWNAHIRNLRQENANDEFPLIFLNPQFAWHPGFEY